MELELWKDREQKILDPQLFSTKAEDFAKKISEEAQRKRSLNKGTQLRSISDLLMEQYLNGIDVYISNGSESSGYTEVAFTSLKKHFIYMKKKSPDSVSYVSKDPNEIDRLHNTFLRIIEGNNCKPIQHFIQTDKQGKLMQDVDGLYKINPEIRNKFWIN